MVSGAAKFLVELLPVPVTPVHQVREQVADRVPDIGAGPPLKFHEHGIRPFGALPVPPLRVWRKWFRLFCSFFYRESRPPIAL